MYTEQDLRDINAQIKTRLGLLLALCALLLVPLVYSLVVRLQWLTVLSTIALGSLLIYYHGLWLSPLYAYRKHLTGTLNGRQRELEGRFQGFDENIALRDKVRFVPFMVNVGEAGNEEDERLLYWDANLPLPQWQEGDRLRVQSFDKAVVSWEKTN